MDLGNGLMDLGNGLMDYWIEGLMGIKRLDWWIVGYDKRSNDSMESN